MRSRHSAVFLSRSSQVANVYINWHFRRQHYNLAVERLANRKGDTTFNTSKDSQKGSINTKLAAATAFVISAAGLGLIGTHEGLRTNAYIDPVGIPTICYGTTANVKMGQSATFDECNMMLNRDAGFAGKAVAKCTKVAITQNQYDSLVSFTYNIGGGAYCASTLVRKLNEGDCWGAGKQFDRWICAGGKCGKLPGLIKRRAEERKLFETGCPTGAV